MKQIALAIFIILANYVANAQAQSFQWVKSFGGASQDKGNSIAIDGNENIYFTGSFSGTVDFDPGTGVANLTSISSRDIFISKLDGSGNFIWAKRIGSTSYNDGIAIALDAFGNVYTTGYFNGTCDFDPGIGTYNMTGLSPSPGYSTSFILKLNSSGIFIWAKQFDASSYDVSTDLLGNVFTTGNFAGTVDFDSGAGVFNLSALGTSGLKDIYVSKLDASGNFVWAKSMGGASNNDESRSIYIDTNNNLYITGSFWGTADFDPSVGVNNLTSVGLHDIFISKLNNLGDFIWAKSMGSATQDIGFSLAVDGNGNVFTTGVFEGTIDFDPGIGTVYLTASGQDVFISKLNASGDFVWVKQIGSTLYDYGNSLVLDSSGDLYAAGMFQNTADFDPNSGIYNLTPSSSDVFIIKLTNSGNFVWAKNFGGTTIVPQIITNSAGDNIYTIGDYDGTADFDPSSSIYNLTSSGLDDFYLHKLSVIAPETYCSFTYSINNMVVNYAKTNPNCTSFIWDFGNGNTSTINPNPIVTYAAPGVYSPCFQCNTPVSCLSCLTITVPSNGNGGTTGVTETIINSTFSLYPNPTNGIIKIELADFKGNELILYTITGQKLFTKMVNDKTNTIDLSNLSNGIYYLQVKNENGVNTEKIILNK